MVASSIILDNLKNTEHCSPCLLFLQSEIKIVFKFQLDLHCWKIIKRLCNFLILTNKFHVTFEIISGVMYDIVGVCWACAKNGWMIKMVEINTMTYEKIEEEVLTTILLMVSRTLFIFSIFVDWWLLIFNSWEFSLFMNRNLIFPKTKINIH